MRKSLSVCFTAVFASLHAVLYFVPFGLWRNWAVFIESIEGVVLGPKIGFTAALLGCSISRMLMPDPLWMFGIVAEPFSVLMAGLLAKAVWKPVLAAYVVMVSAYFIHPFSRSFPIWTILDILLAMALIYPAAKFSSNLFGSHVKSTTTSLLLISFVCIVTDSLVRVFLFIPCGLYSLFSLNFEGVYAAFVGGALNSYFEDLIVVAVSFVVGTPLIVSLSKLRSSAERKVAQKNVS